MSSTYSGDHSNATSARASTKSIGQAIQRTREWMVTYQSTSSHASSMSSASRRSSKQDELDLDSLFKRLDKYTAEMQEIEDRLKRARTVSDKSDRISIKRLSFESHHTLDEIEYSAPSLNNTSRLQATRVRKKNDQASQEVFDDWKTWVDEQFGSAQPPSGQNDSKHSSYRSERGSPSFNSTWLRLSSTPPGRASPRKSSPKEALALNQLEYQRQASEQDYDEKEFCDDEPGPSVPTSWSLPPRTSSKQLINEDRSPEPKLAATKPAPRRRMTTTEGRPSIRNGGFWSEQSAGLLPRDDIPTVPVLSQSNSNATLKSSPPPTPLTMGDPREDQVRRELEAMSIHAGAEGLENRYKNRRPPMLNLLQSDDEDDDEDLKLVPKSAGLPQTTLLDVNDDHSARPRSRRRKSVFSIFQRRSPVEKLIDMYFDDEPEERPVSRRASTWSRTVSSGQEKIPKSPSMPPVPQNLHAKQTSL